MGTVEIKGQQYLTTLPGLLDFEEFTTYLRQEYTREKYSAIPEGLTEAQFNRFAKRIDEEADKIDATNDFTAVLRTHKGTALVFYSILRRRNPQIDLSFVHQLVKDASVEAPEALQSLRNLRQALEELFREHKKHQNPTDPAAPKGVRRKNKAARKSAG